MKTKPKLNKNALRLVRALEGKKVGGRIFKQTQHLLCRIEHGERVGYCCLGVACEVYNHFAKVDGHKPLKAEAQSGYVKFGTGRYASHEFLPLVVQRWLGLASDAGEYDQPQSNLGEALSENNDVDKMSFPQIAAIIRSKPKGLFRRGR